MRIRNVRLLLSFGLGCLLLLSCKEEKMSPLPNDGSMAPQQVSNIQVINLNGEAKIVYTVPPDQNLLYVEADWTYHGQAKNTQASYYSDTLDIQGFGDTSEYQIKIYSVSTGQVKSAPQTVTVKPLISPVQMVFASLTTKPDFGGVNVGFTNITGADIIITVLSNDSTSKFEPVNSFYTDAKVDSFSTRGFDSLPRKFGVFVKDPFGNLSDTLYTTLSPYFEVQLNKANFKQLIPYPGDVNSNIYSSAYPMTNLWDNSESSIYVTKTNLGMPESFTIDLGVTARLDRMLYYQRQSTAFYFASATPEVFDVYGSNNPDPTGDWSSWTLLQHCISQKPSGLPLGVVSNDDIAFAQAGETFNFPLSTTGYRYLRFNVTQTYGNATSITFAELTFFGGI